jgi:hypothetical protein
VGGVNDNVRQTKRKSASGAGSPPNVTQWKQGNASKKNVSRRRYYVVRFCLFFTAGIAEERSTSTDRERLEASKVAQSVADLYMNAYDKHDLAAEREGYQVFEG